MFKPTIKVLGLALVLSVMPRAYGADSADEIQQLKDRVKALEESAQKPAPVAVSSNSGNAFNPKISLILDGAVSNYTHHSAPDIPGFLLSPDAGPRPQGINLGETELAVESNIDDQFHGWTTLSVKPEGGISVEEAFINTLALPAGFALKFGRFFSDIGYQNHQHAHAWEFVDAPLVYRAMLGNQLGDDGLQIRWLAPTDLLLELGSEVLRGGAFPSGGDLRRGAKSFTGYVHLGGDAGVSGSWRLGLSHLKADADQRDDGQDRFSGSSHLTILDGVYKWAPQGNPEINNFVAQAEYFFRRESGTVAVDPDTSGYAGHQQGYYVQGVYQFIQRWRLGLRYDHLSSSNTLDNPVPGTVLAQLVDHSHAPQRVSVMTDFSNSEFSRIRLQYNHDTSRPQGTPDNQVFLQYIFSLGSHPAHQF